MKYEDWKAEMSKCFDEMAELALRTGVAIKKMDQVENLDPHEALGFIKGQEAKVQAAMSAAGLA